MKAIPYSEALLLSVYFEELSLKAAEDRKEAASGSSSSSHDGFETDDVIGDGDEIDYFAAKRQGLIK